MESIISVRNVGKVFHDDRGKPLTVLSDITFAVAAGEVFVLLGPSGSGKSTLLRIMSGLETANAGRVEYGGNIGRRDVSFVFQQFALLPWLTVRQNIMLGLSARRMPADEQAAMVARELKRFHLERFADARPRDLSGGMRQRVGIARALATDPKIIFMDEPFSELDSFTAAELRQELLAIWAERRPTIVLVTHLISEALELGDRIAVLTSRPGHIEEVVPNPLPRPRRTRAPEFFRLEDRLAALVRP